MSMMTRSEMKPPIADLNLEFFLKVRDTGCPNWSMLARSPPNFSRNYEPFSRVFASTFP